MSSVSGPCDSVEASTEGHGPLTLLVHLMSAGRLMLYDKRGSLRDKTSRVLIRLPGERELRLREFGTKQAAWLKVLTLDGLEAEPSSGLRKNRLVVSGLGSFGILIIAPILALATMPPLPASSVFGTSE